MLNQIPTVAISSIAGIIMTVFVLFFTGILTNVELTIYFLLMAVCVLLLLITIFVSIILYMIIHRKKVFEMGALVPEEWAVRLEDTTSEMKKASVNASKSIENHKRLAEALLNNSEELKDITFQRYSELDAKDKQIETLEKGTVVVAKLSLLLRLISLAREFSRSETAISPQKAVEMIEEILFHEGVKEISVKKGKNVDDFEGWVELVGSPSEPNPELPHGTVLSVVRPGYSIDGPARSHILRKAAVTYNNLQAGANQ